MPININNNLYNFGLDVLLVKEKAIEKLQDKLKTGTWVYDASVKVEDVIRDAFVDLLQTKYPELAAISDNEVEAMIMQFPQIQGQIEGLRQQLTVSLGSFSSIAALEDALTAAKAAVTAAEADITTAQANIVTYTQTISSTEAAIPGAAAQLQAANGAYLAAVAIYGTNPNSPELIEAGRVLGEAENLMFSLQSTLASARQQLTAANAQLATAESVLLEKQALVPALQTRFDTADAIQQQIDGFSGNVVYNLYSTFSSKEKELVALVTT